jgi:eukaryotic-like serine/threonine-protein kinase
MSLGALSLALLLGGVNAGCARSGQGRAAAAAPAPPAEGTGTAGAPVQVWRAKTGRRFTGRMVVAGETIFGGSVDRKVYAVSLADGETQWSARLGGLIAGGVLVEADTVYAASSRPEGKVYALNARTGRRLWRTSTGPVGAPLTLVGGLVIAETQRGVVVALDSRSGTVRWRRRVGVSRIPAVPADSGTILVATVDSLFRLSAKDGKIVRRARSPGAIVSPWIEHHDLLLAGTTDSLVIALDPGELRTSWRATLDAPVLGSPAVVGDTLYAVTRRGTLYRLSMDSTSIATPVAELHWPVTAPVTVVDGLVLLGGADGIIRALRPDGTEAWRVQLRWPVELGPLPLADGILAIGGDGDLHRYRR